MKYWSTDFKAPIAQSVEQHHGKVEVVSAIPARGTKTQWGRSSLGRALGWQSRGSQFDPDRLHQIIFQIGVCIFRETLAYRLLLKKKVLLITLVFLNYL